MIRFNRNQMTFFYPYILYSFSGFLLIPFFIFHFSFFIFDFYSLLTSTLTVNNILPSLFQNLVLLFHALRKSQVEITIWKLGKNNFDIHYPCNILSFAGVQKDDRANRLI